MTDATARWHSPDQGGVLGPRISRLEHAAEAPVALPAEPRDLSSERSTGATLSRLIDGLRDADPLKCRPARDDLRQMGRSAVPALTAATHDSDPELRRNAIDVL